jgi:ATP-binding cassette subfamily B protein
VHAVKLMAPPARAGVYRRVAGAVWRSLPGLSVCFGLLVLLRCLSPLLFALTVVRVLTTIPAAVAAGTGSAAEHRLLLSVVWMSIAFVLQQATPLLVLHLGSYMGRVFNADLDRRLLRAALSPAGIWHMEDPKIAGQLAAARTGVSGWPRAGHVVSALGGRLAQFFGLVSGAALVAAFSWYAAVSLLGAGLVLRGRVARAMNELGSSQAAAADELRALTYIGRLGLEPMAAKEVRLFGLRSWLVGRRTDVAEKARGALAAARADGQRSVRLAILLMCLVATSVVADLGWRVARGEVSLTVVVLTVQGLLLLATTVGDGLAVRDGVILGYASAALDRAESLETQLLTADQRLTGAVHVAGLPREGIRFTNVSFRYPTSDRDVLHDVTLTIPAGSSLGIVGLNGAGKTTLLKLLCRLYEPTSGSIFVDGHDLRSLNPHEWQRRVAATFQDFVHYPWSVLDNVTLGADDEATRELVGQMTGLQPILTGLPEAWETVLATQAGGGAELSGGQWQRVALARAVYAARRGAPVLVLDEPTASLDVRAEAEIYDRFVELTKGCTTILISHRLSSLRKTDRIAVLEGGRIVEYGPHRDLLDAGGRYAELFRLQASAFAADAGSPP